MPEYHGYIRQTTTDARFEVTNITDTEVAAVCTDAGTDLFLSLGATQTFTRAELSDGPYDLTTCDISASSVTVDDKQPATTHAQA